MNRKIKRKLLLYFLPEIINGKNKVRRFTTFHPLYLVRNYKNTEKLFHEQCYSKDTDLVIDMDRHSLMPQKDFSIFRQVVMIYLWITNIKIYKMSIRRNNIVKVSFHLSDNLSTQFFDSSHNVYSTRWGWFVHMENIYYWIKVLILFLACSALLPRWTDQ